ncbi:Chemotaxis protein CheY [Pseudoalteromonas holothuriae]|uniref:Chemotaxis protein CheY n=1 Tax=Pseudoalteromonas holothuriae TaxID=2963714 RepID=A0A9W4R2Q6_9GAMM|nr:MULTISPECIES: response regulator [unclassified Pseudoalteromonas]CAH9063773.1 Chemotaxis protein CheY [Pseudoalteromonas sp. CIP111854]CAH9064648.1 Chemotaxis protein CheY [Pseudoalteromonas sp. CIP111951]
MKILVVDDMPLMRHVMLNMLRRLEYTDVSEATDGEQAIELLQATKFDLLITDLNMPKMNGQELIDKIRAELKQANLAVLVVTCDDNKQTVLNLISAQIDGMMVKPFTLNTLKRQLQLVFSRRDKPPQ